MKHAAVHIPGTPPLLIGSALLFWGWQNNLIISAIVMAVLLEARYVIRRRFPISDKEFNHLSDVTAIIFFISVIYIFNEDGSKGIFTILAVNPYVLYLLVLLQVYSERGKIKLSTLFMSMRKIERANPNEAIPSIDLTYPYFLLCLLAASAGQHTGAEFFIGLCLLIAAMLLSFRPRRYPVGLWLAMFCLAISLSYAGQAGMLALQDVFRANMMQLFEQFVWRYRDPDRTSTAIGSIGRFKLSDRIVLRAATPTRLTRRLYLREATYNLYGLGLWSNSDTRFEPVAETGQTEVWELNQSNPTGKVTIASYFLREAEVIPLPHGSQRLYQVPAIEVQRNAMNTVKMDIYDGWVKYSVDYVDATIFDAPPDDSTDLYMPKNYRELFYGLADELGLQDLPDEQKIGIVEDWFASHFSYTLEQTYWHPQQDFLQQFLHEHRKGHCEYFATATVLLLRAAGIPARYAVGYAVDEYSPWEGQYVARARDAHAWVLAYTNHDWQLIDTTPGIWDALEAENASIMEPLWDVWSWVSYRYALWQAKDALKEENRTWLLLLIIPLLLYLAWRLHGKKRNGRHDSDKTTGPIEIFGADSPLYQLADIIRQKGIEQRPGETLLAWFKRYPAAQADVDMQSALALHYQYRFDPSADRKALKQRLEAVCQHIRQTLRRHESRP